MLKNDTKKECRMKKLLQRIMLLSMLVVNTQQTQTAWYSSWGEFQSAVATQWNSFTDWVTSWWRKTPEQTAATLAMQDISTVVKNLDGFTFGIGQLARGAPGTSPAEFEQKYENLITILNKINKGEITHPILTTLKNLPWQELSNYKKLRAQQYPINFWNKALTDANIPQNLANPILRAVTEHSDMASINDLKIQGNIKNKAQLEAKLQTTALNALQEYFTQEYKKMVQNFEQSLKEYPKLQANLEWTKTPSRFYFFKY